ncbi:MAG: hypothetical protein HAW67_05230 [Endozoicomonadaceae bacterium]|nr:hypothetical protein [Endozoicomonadaceae bacterium]
MTEKRPKTSQKDKDAKQTRYNKMGREPLFRVEISTADSNEDAEEMRKMKTVLIAKSGTAKKGVVDMYKFAKENGYFDK